MTGMTTLHYACRGGNKALTKLILDAAREEMMPEEFGGFLNKASWMLKGTALSCAVATQCTDIVQLLLEAGADPNVYTAKDGNHFPTALACAVQMENIDLVNLLLDNGKYKAELFIN